MAVRLREWQNVALQAWIDAGRRGIISVVTGGGKTVFALACMDAVKASTVLIVVPTVALLDQWWEEAANFFSLKLDEVHVVTGAKRMKAGTINMAVLNTASKLQDKGRALKCFLVVDECHKAASSEFRNVLEIPKDGSLGLSATPERPYDEWLDEFLVPELGPVIFRYGYADALRDKIIVPFVLSNIVFDLESDTQTKYDQLTRRIGRAISEKGADADETIRLFLRRARIMNMSLKRVELALRLIARHRGSRILVFHEDIGACNLIREVLTQHKIRAGVYHSKMKVRDRAEQLSQYRSGQLDVLVTCRALDEGFNVPETEIGIIAASTATRRQRIQRLGRILRPSAGKDHALIYTLVATTPEIQRLKDEEATLSGLAKVEWSSL